MLIDPEWYIFFQQFWVQNIMGLIFAIIFLLLMAFELLSKDDPLYMRIVPKERPPSEAFRSDD
tara:strand:+ start:1042 stop:1230 length:189 start_codon:yes stop_codon:yes gene_type:complete